MISTILETSNFGMEETRKFKTNLLSNTELLKYDNKVAQQKSEN